MFPRFLEGLVVGQTVSVDATTLEANAAMRSIVRRSDGQSYEAFVSALAEANPQLKGRVISAPVRPFTIETN